MNTINKINAYLRERGLLNEEEDKKTETSPKEIQVRFIKKVETDKMENKEIEGMKKRNKFPFRFRLVITFSKFHKKTI